MKEVPGLYADFRAQFPEILEKNEELGRMVHEQGPLDEKTRSLVKIGIAAASLHLTRSPPRSPEPGRQEPTKTRSFTPFCSSSPPADSRPSCRPTASTRASEACHGSDLTGTSRPI